MILTVEISQRTSGQRKALFELPVNGSVEELDGE
jgi:hypothetical protein